MTKNIKKLQSAAYALAGARNSRLRGAIEAALGQEKYAEQCLRAVLNERDVDEVLTVWECSFGDTPGEAWNIIRPVAGINPRCALN